MADIKPIDKDSDYNSTILRMRNLLKEHGFEIAESSLKNPVKGIWSVHISEKNCPFIYTNGKGATQMAALASGLGEFFERISCNYLFSDYYLNEIQNDFFFYPDEIWLDEENYRKSILSEDLWKFYGEDLGFDELIDFNSGRDEVCAIPFTCERCGKRVYFPVNILDNLYVSNGMAAGNSVHEAKVQALSEIIERNIKFRIISEGICLPEVPHSVLENYPEILDSLSKLIHKGFKIVVNDASLGGKYPVININLINSSGGVFSAFGAHPFLKTAMERTLTELMQGRDFDQLQDLKKPSMDMDLVASSMNLEEHFIDSAGFVSIRSLSDNPDYTFGFRDFEGNTKDQYEYLLRIFEEEGKEIYTADYDHYGIYCCRIIVPDFSEIYPVSDLFENNRNTRADLRNWLLDPSISDTVDIKELYSFLMDGDFEYSSDIFELTGIIPDGDSVFTVCELLFLLSLTLKINDDTLMWFDMIDIKGVAQTRRKLYECLSLMISVEESYEEKDYNSYLNYVFGEDIQMKALSVLRNPSELLKKALYEIAPGKRHKEMTELFNRKGNFSNL